MSAPKEGGRREEEEGREGKSRGKAKTKGRESRDTVSPSKDNAKSVKAAAVENGATVKVKTLNLPATLCQMRGLV